ncbi:MAG: methionyl-tRNA formyltransferase [Bacteroidales bacterium]|nr:methionyl-tRNA formyltransferase [Bacteroidales bacterium]
MIRELRILFMGTPEFAVAGLDALIRDKQHVIAVVTSMDKPAGRGRKIRTSPIKDYALSQNIPVLQPEKLKSPSFLAELQDLQPDLLVVVAFRMLPEQVWKLPPMGTINLHASLLPQYRGAAPINRVLMNGETETGLTTFFIEKEIDTGKIILQETVPVDPDEDAGSLHDKMMNTGASLLVRTVRAIAGGNPPLIDQTALIRKQEELKTAPKIFTENCRVDWDQETEVVYNHIRGLAPYPAAWTILKNQAGEEKILKIFAAEKEILPVNEKPGTLLADDENALEIACRNGIIRLTRIQLEGKKKMDTPEFLRGLKDVTGLHIT